MKKTLLATALLVAASNAQAVDPATALSVASIVSSIPGHIERFTGNRSTKGQGEYVFGPDVSENFACNKAEGRAKLDAIRNILGEEVFAQQSKQCFESNGQVDCKTESDVWSISDAHLRKSKITSREVTEQLGNKACKITIDAQVTNDRPFADLHVNSKFVYKDGETMKMEVISNKPAMLHIFHIEGNKAMMVFPNVFQKESRIENSISIPTAEYAMTIKASKFDESIVFVLTKEPQNFLKEYDVAELNNRLLSIPIRDRKIVRRNLVIEQ